MTTGSNEPCPMNDISLAARLKAGLRLPVMAGPMFIASTADLVIAQCQAGIIGAMPALNPRSTAALDDDLSRIAAAVGDRPWCVNLVAHKSNERLAPDRSEEPTSELQSLMRTSY